MTNFGPWKSISPEAKLSLLIAKALVSDTKAGAIEEFLNQEQLDWYKFNKIITCHELSPSAYIFLKKYPEFIHQDELKLLERHFYANLLHLNLIQQELMKILQSFQEENIIALPLKGAHFLLDTSIYRDKAYLRPMIDIDILLKKETYHQAQNILESQGYKMELKGNREEYWLNKNCNMAFIKMLQDNCSYIVELHWALDYPRGIRLLPHLWSRIKRIEVEGNNIYLSSPEDAFFSLILHQRRFGNALPLKRACDAAILLTRYKGELDWDYMIEEAARGKMRTILYFALSQIETLFDIKIPPSVLKISGVPDYKKKLIRNLLLRDTFKYSLNLNSVYLKAHFFLYDDFREPVKSILNIPQEQFAKFYNLKPYTAKTDLLYRWRYLRYLKTLILNKY
ncbi:MAG: nucleotidyltransferase family protein [Candidatus Omnitrophota bacterium]